ncbi:antitoxin Xre-like helix-turn-helix domain-containing protein [Chitinivorax sp. B]|uniref:antitoxin Xre-like helix-turn-helix domain-containing protein n=1 Tax=Chitinivorax sp. B TaxID=2502235 RepID=UPI0010F56378|nr:antitoxin Xre-like helix-turn-helix domain-containing protein [Chitinivorax sp. B]
MSTALDNLLAAPPAEQIAALRAGLLVGEAATLVGQLGLTTTDLAPALGLSPATLTRRLRAAGQFDPAASERLLRLARIAHHAAQAFGDPARAGAWLAHPHRLLGAAPLTLLDTAHGGHAVERQLLAIEHGLPS